jgi:hypothetical protein
MTKFTIEGIENGWILYTHYALSSNATYYSTLDEALKAVEEWRCWNGIERDIKQDDDIEAKS